MASPPRSLVPNDLSNAAIKKQFPPGVLFLNLNQIQAYAKNHLFHFQARVQHFKRDPFSFSKFCPDRPFFAGICLNSSMDMSSDELWYMWCLTVLYSGFFVFPVWSMYKHLHNNRYRSSLIWTFLEWFNPLSWWRDRISNIMERDKLWSQPVNVSSKAMSIWIFHRPYFQHPVTKLFWSQNQAQEWRSIPNSVLLRDNNLIKDLANHLASINNFERSTVPIHCTSLGPRHEIFMFPTDSQSPSSSLSIKDEGPSYTDPLFQDAQDPYADFDIEMTPANQEPAPGPVLSENEAWLNSVCGYPIDSDDSEYDNYNLSPSQNSM